MKIEITETEYFKFKIAKAFSNFYATLTNPYVLAVSSGWPSYFKALEQSLNKGEGSASPKDFPCQWQMAYSEGGFERVTGVSFGEASGTVLCKES